MYSVAAWLADPVRGEAPMSLLKLNSELEKYSPASLPTRKTAAEMDTLKSSMVSNLACLVGRAGAIWIGRVLQSCPCPAMAVCDGSCRRIPDNVKIPLLFRSCGLARSLRALPTLV